MLLLAAVAALGFSDVRVNLSERCQGRFLVGEGTECSGAGESRCPDIGAKPYAVPHAVVTEGAPRLGVDADATRGPRAADDYSETGAASRGAVGAPGPNMTPIAARMARAGAAVRSNAEVSHERSGC